MAEGFSYIPEEDEVATPEASPVKKVDAIDKFKLFIGDLFRPKEKKEEDEEDAERAGKKGRFARAWRKLFGSVAQKEDVAEGAPGPAQGLFFERSTIEDVPTEAAPESPQLEAYEQVNTPEVTQAAAAVEIPLHAPAGEAVATAEQPETTIYASGLGAADRNRIHTAERKAEKAEKEVSELRREVKKAESHQSRPEVKAPQPQTAPERVSEPRRSESVLPIRPEIVREAKKTIEKAPERILQIPTEKSFEKEKIYNVTPEINKVVEKLEEGESKEIAYELSHEHKDMDKQSTAAWLTLQAQADAQAKANAAAIAQAATLQNDRNAAVKAKDTAGEPTAYQKAAVTGFTTAVIIAVIVLVILLVQSK